MTEKGTSGAADVAHVPGAWCARRDVRVCKGKKSRLEASATNPLTCRRKRRGGHVSYDGGKRRSLGYAPFEAQGERDDRKGKSGATENDLIWRCGSLCWIQFSMPEATKNRFAFLMWRLPS
jgi:hypothetical protein